MCAQRASYQWAQLLPEVHRLSSADRMHSLRHLRRLPARHPFALNCAMFHLAPAYEGCLLFVRSRYLVATVHDLVGRVNKVRRLADGAHKGGVG